MLGHHRRRRALRRAISAAVVSVAGLGAATPALAASSSSVATSSSSAAGGAAAAQPSASSISAATNTANPEQAVPVDLTFSGTNAGTATAQVEAVVRPAGGLACQSSYNDDISTLGAVDSIILGPNNPNATAPSGTYSVAAEVKPPQPGSYQVCAWLDGGSGADPQAPPATLTFTARGPQVSQLTVTTPANPAPHTDFPITYTVQTDQSLTLYSVLQPVGDPAAACPASFESAMGESPRPATLLGLTGEAVYGGPATSGATSNASTGRYLVCTWVEGPNYGEVDAANSTAMTVGTPVPPPPASPGLRVTRVAVSRRHGISVAGTTASAFTGRLVVSAACGRASARSARSSAAVRRGRFSARLSLPAACRSARTVKVTVGWAGSAAYAKQAASRSVAIKR